MPDEMLAAAAAFRRALAGFDPTLLAGADCAVVAEALAVTEKACAAARAAAAARAVETRAHIERGFSDGIAWLARQAGTTRGSARQAVEVARTADACPPAKEALMAGELSLDEAAEIIKPTPRCPARPRTDWHRYLIRRKRAARSGARSTAPSRGSRRAAPTAASGPTVPPLA